MALSAKDFGNWVQAGKLAAQALSYGSTLVTPGARLLDVVDKIDQKIIDAGAMPAFPSQISLDATAAHYCPDADDHLILSDQLAKVDIGVCFEGAVADTALTVDLSGKNARFVQAVDQAVADALKLAVPGTRLGDIGKAISDRIGSHGLVPIRNLTGHGVGKFEIHTWPTVPNYPNGDMTVLERDMVIAIEPFATNGEGATGEAGLPQVFMEVARKPVRLQGARDALSHIEAYKGLPFARRWLYPKIGRMQANLALSQLVQIGALEQFPPLVERRRGLVSQAEHTVIVREEPLVITKRA